MNVKSRDCAVKLIEQRNAQFKNSKAHNKVSRYIQFVDGKL